ncbi:uncharacterized protein LOC124535420 [Vanessa cardui]|uniref:uncharacterized protein LOC124535420 n=1 Tax=Vanessa cardui TaxID=171605 RepID=UPI001F136EDE|nr:uncharacterized protein LOC124535420 [Vanessa cardui]
MKHLDIKHIEYIILSFSAIILQKKKLMIFFRKLHSYDQMLKIDTDDTITTFGYLSLMFGIDKFKVLSKKVNLDISTLHKVYDLLHQCFEELNSIISFPIIVILTTSAMSTIALLKKAYMLIKNGYNLYGTEDEEFYSLFYIFVVLRCLKTTVIMMFPCYFSHVTKNQAACIRSMLYDILSNTNLYKTAYRKLKAFLLLTHENTFSYALWGIIKFDLSLPLSFYNLCVTYLIISIQFSKIID